MLITRAVLDATATQCSPAAEFAGVPVPKQTRRRKAKPEVEPERTIEPEVVTPAEPVTEQVTEQVPEPVTPVDNLIVESTPTVGAPPEVDGEVTRYRVGETWYSVIVGPYTNKRGQTNLLARIVKWFRRRGGEWDNSWVFSCKANDPSAVTALLQGAAHLQEVIG